MLCGAFRRQPLRCVWCGSPTSEGEGAGGQRPPPGAACRVLLLGNFCARLSKGVGVLSLLAAETRNVHRRASGLIAATFMPILRLLARQTRLPRAPPPTIATDGTRYGEGRARGPRVPRSSEASSRC